ncbi:hypothetical protein VTI74DRAFT_3700 [Chaetomium olivicolor]
MPSIAARSNPSLSSPLTSLARSSQSSKQVNRETWPFGLCTPPTDEDMGTAYEVAHLPSCEKYALHPHSAYTTTVPQPDRRRSILNERPPPNEQIFHSSSRCAAPFPTQSQTRTVTGPRPGVAQNPLPAPARTTAISEYSQWQDSSRSSQRPPPTSRSSSVHGEKSVADSKMTLHSMRIPERISPSGGSISDFMAGITALFWFETTKLLDNIEQAQALVPAAPRQPLSSTAIADENFKKWVSTVLRTTQVTQNVVILALLYIYRLKMANPTVKGRPGSEYRLLTVALMLANKFLDDNTYTNKTWADVSGISVNEIHVMEVEFLSNMRYTLLVSAEQWEQWLGKLTRFWSYLELAQRVASPSPSPLLIPSPSHRSYASPLQSPTVPLTPGVQSATHSFALHSPNLAPLINGNQNWPASYVASNAASPLAQKPQPVSYRKRSFPEEEDAAEHPAKRVSRIPVGQAKPSGHIPSQAPFQPPSVSTQVPPSLPNPTAVPAVHSRPTHGLPSDQGRPPVPSLTLNTAQTAEVPATQPYGVSAYAPPQSTPLSLPPLASGVRAMSMVFPTATYASSQPISATCGTVTPTTTVPPTYDTPTKRLSPQDSFATYPGSSPLVMATPIGNAGTASGLHTPISHSPSIYLQQRNSPYKPVRHVNTLLYPPPSAFLQQYHFPSPVMPSQMHYQPLGKRNEFRTGILPEFLANRPPALHPAVTPAPYNTLPQVLPNPQQVKGTQRSRPGPAAYSGQY